MGSENHPLRGIHKCFRDLKAPTALAQGYWPYTPGLCTGEEWVSFQGACGSPNTGLQLCPLPLLQPQLRWAPCLWEGSSQSSAQNGHDPFQSEQNEPRALFSAYHNWTTSAQMCQPQVIAVPDQERLTTEWSSPAGSETTGGNSTQSGESARSKGADMAETKDGESPCLG